MENIKFSRMLKCENCATMQECNKSNKHRYTCEKLKPIGEIPPKPKKTKLLCADCYNNYYNSAKDKAPDGCWSFKDSEVILKSYPYSLSAIPPHEVKWVLSCFYRKW